MADRLRRIMNRACVLLYLTRWFTAPGRYDWDNSWYGGKDNYVQWGGVRLLADDIKGAINF